MARELMEKREWRMKNCRATASFSILHSPNFMMVPGVKASRPAFSLLELHIIYELLDLLLILFFANEQNVVCVDHDIAIETVQHSKFTLGNVYHIVGAVV
jgi:hypothetical protein